MDIDMYTMRIDNEVKMNIACTTSVMKQSYNKVVLLTGVYVLNSIKVNGRSIKYDYPSPSPIPEKNKQQK